MTRRGTVFLYQAVEMEAGAPPHAPAFIFEFPQQPDPQAC